MKSSLLLLGGALVFMGADAANSAAAPNLHEMMKNVVAAAQAGNSPYIRCALCRAATHN